MFDWNFGPWLHGMGFWQTKSYCGLYLPPCQGVVFALPFLLSACCIPLYGLFHNAAAQSWTTISQMHKMQHLFRNALYATCNTSG